MMPQIRLPQPGLRGKLLILLSGIVCVILAGQTTVWLSSAVTDLDHRIAAQGVVQAQGIAAGCADMIEHPDRQRLEQMLQRVAKVIDVRTVEVLRTDGQVLVHHGPPTDPAARPTPLGVFDRPRRGPGLAGLAGGKVLYAAQAPVVRDAQVVGHVALTWVSSEIEEKSTRLILVALVMALIWLVVGAGLGTLYVHRITRPLRTLTEAVSQVSSHGLQALALQPAVGTDELAVLHNAFVKMADDLREQRDENAQLLVAQQQHNQRLRERVDAMTADLRDHVARLYAVIGALRDGVVTLDRESDVVDANPAAARHLQGFCKPSRGMAAGELLPDAAELVEAVQAVLADGRARDLRVEQASAAAPFGQETEPPLGSGTYLRTIAVHVAPIVLGTDAPLGAVLVLRDCTVELLAEARLRRQDRLVSLGTLAAGLAHELGNAMHAIHGFTALLLRDTPAHDPRRKDVQTIRDENQRAVELLERFLQFARPRPMALRDERPAALVDEALAICAWRLRKVDVQVECAVSPDAHTLRCDGQLIVQVFINLILNAVDAMEGCPNRCLTICGRMEGTDRVVLEFGDSGPGVSAQLRERIFDPFFTTKDTGTGLGLAIANQIVASHGGALTVHSPPGRGAVFAVSLPTRGRMGSSARYLRGDVQEKP